MNLGDLKATLSIDEGSINVATANVKKALQKAGIDSGKSLDEGITDGAKKGASNAEKEIKKSVGNIKTTFGELKSFMTKVFGFTAAMELGKWILGLWSKAETTAESFNTLLKSEEKAVAMIQDIEDFAAKTPFEKMGLTESVQKLIGMGIAAERALPTMQVLGDAISAVGGGKDKLDRIVLALGQIQAKGKLSMEEVIQIAENWIPIFDILKEQLGLTQKQLGNLGNEGIKSSVAINAILTGMNSKFAGSMEKQSKIMAGQWSTFKDNVTNTMTELAEPIDKAFTGILGNINDSFSQSEGNVKDSAKTAGWLMAGLLEGAIITFSGIANMGAAAFSWVTDSQKEELGNQNSNWKVAMVWGSAFLKGIMGIVATAAALVAGAGWTALNSLVFIGKTVMNVLGGIVWSSMNLLVDKVNWVFKKINEGAKLVGLDMRIPLLDQFDGLSTAMTKTADDFIRLSESNTNTSKSVLDAYARTMDGLMEWMVGDFEKLNTKVELVSGSAKAQEDVFKRNAEALKKMKDELEKWKGDMFMDWDKGKKPKKSSGQSAAEKQEAEDTKRSVDKLKDSYSDLKSKIKDSERAAEEYSSTTQKLNRDIADSLREVGKQMDENEKKRSDALAKTAEEAKTKKTWSTEDYAREQAVKQVELAKDVAEIQADIENRKAEAAKKSETVRGDLLDKQKNLQNELAVAELRRAEFTSSTAEATRKENEFRIASLKSQLEEIKNGTGLSETDKTLLDLQEKLLEKQNALADVKSNLKNLTDSETGGADALKTKVSEILDVETKRAAMSEQKRAEFDFKQKLAEIDQEKATKDADAEADFQREKTKLDRQAKIYEYFQKNKDLTARQLKLIQDGEDFKTASKEEQDLILKLGRERMEITDKKNQKIAAEQEVADATAALSNQVTETLRANVIALKAEYADLIKEIRAAIDAQRALSGTGTGSAKRGFSSGGYTGDGAISEVAGIVHRGEYVVPSHVLQSIPSLIPQLEAARSGRVDNSRNVSITGPITVNREMDFQLLLERAKFRM